MENALSRTLSDKLFGMNAQEKKNNWLFLDPLQHTTQERLSHGATSNLTLTYFDIAIFVLVIYS